MFRADTGRAATTPGGIHGRAGPDDQPGADAHADPDQDDAGPQPDRDANADRDPGSSAHGRATTPGPDHPGDAPPHHCGSSASPAPADVLRELCRRPRGRCGAAPAGRAGVPAGFGP